MFVVVYAVLENFYPHHAGSEPVIQNIVMITVILNLSVYVFTGLLFNSLISVSVQQGFFY